jgi:hypothetical protein
MSAALSHRLVLVPDLRGPAALRPAGSPRRYRLAGVPPRVAADSGRFEYLKKTYD